MSASAVGQFTSPEGVYEVDRLLEHFKSRVTCRPFSTHDVFVEVLSGTKSENETTTQHYGCGRRRLCDDCRMDSDRWASYTRADSNLLGCLRDCAEHTP